MDRRTFLKNGALGASALATTSTLGLAAADAAVSPAPRRDFQLKYAPHFGMFEQHAGKDLIDQIKFMADAGFRALEDNRLMQRPTEMQEKIGNQLDKLGMKMGVFVVDKGGNAANSRERR